MNSLETTTDALYEAIRMYRLTKSPTWLDAIGALVAQLKAEHYAVAYQPRLQTLVVSRVRETTLASALQPTIEEVVRNARY